MGVESSKYGIFGSIPTMGAREQRSFSSKTVNLGDSGELHQLRNIFPKITRIGWQAMLLIKPYEYIFLFISFRLQKDGPGWW